jgi:hypothetical protein
MNGTVAITDHGWYEFLPAQNGLDEMNFWTPSAYGRSEATMGRRSSSSSRRAMARPASAQEIKSAGSSRPNQDLSCHLRYG